jgi:hypothetical protein
LPGSIVSAVQGYALMGAVSTRTVHGDEADVIGPVEAQGWKLEHVSTAFVQTGSSATKRVLANVGSTAVATHVLSRGALRVPSRRAVRLAWTDEETARSPTWGPGRFGSEGSTRNRSSVR